MEALAKKRGLSIAQWGTGLACTFEILTLARGSAIHDRIAAEVRGRFQSRAVRPVSACTFAVVGSAKGRKLQHVFAADVTTCVHCQGRMRLLDVATTADATARAMARAGLAPQPPPPPSQPSRVHPSQLPLLFG